MALDTKQIAAQVITFLRALTMRQRVLLGGSVALVAGTLWAFVALTSKGDYKPLYTGLSPEEAQTIAQRLASQNIPFELSSDRTSLSVPSGELDKVRLEMASQGMPVTGRLGFELFDKPNWAGSDFYEKVNYQRALEGELERTIESLRDVDSARVHLVMPHESLFTEREREGKAAVLVRLRGPRLSEDSINSITFLVSSAVDNLRPENVTVVDADGRVPISNRGSNGQNWSRGGAEFENTLVQKLIATLTPVVGADHIRANVTVDLDTASSDTTQETYDPNGSVVLSSQISSDQLNDDTSQGVPGTTSNTPQPQPASAAANAQSPQQAASAADNANSGDDGATQGERSESKTFAVSKTLRHILQPPGNIKKISAIVLLDDAAEGTGNGQSKPGHKFGADELKQVHDLAVAAIGMDTTRGDNLSVETLPFLHPSQENSAPGTADKVLIIVNQWFGMIRYLVLALLFLVVYLLVLKPVKNQLVVTLSKMLPMQGGAQAPALMGAGSGALANPGLGNEGLLLDSGQSNEANRSLLLKHALVSRVENQPEEASQVIQGWLIEDKGL